MAAVAGVQFVVEMKEWHAEGWMRQVYDAHVTAEMICEMDGAWESVAIDICSAILGELSFGRLTPATCQSLAILPLSVIANVLPMHEARKLIDWTRKPR